MTFVIQVGFALFGSSIAILIRANLGTSPWVMLTVALSQIFGLTLGIMTMIIGVFVLAGSLILRERIGWGTLGNILFIGPWMDLALSIISPVTGNLILQIAILLASALLMGLASAIYIGVDAGAGPRDTLMLAVERHSRSSLRLARSSIEVVVVLFGWLLGGPAGNRYGSFCAFDRPSGAVGFQGIQCAATPSARVRICECQALMKWKRFNASHRRRISFAGTVCNIVFSHSFSPNTTAVNAYSVAPSCQQPTGSPALRHKLSRYSSRSQPCSTGTWGRSNPR